MEDDMQLSRIIGAAVAMIAIASVLPAQQAKGKADLKAQAKISEDSARAIALSKLPAGSMVRESELEREKGTIVWSFDIKVPKRAGVEEVLVSALDGHVVSRVHESAKMEKAEAAKEKKAAAKKP
jgi:hypothetical protein